MSGLKKIDIMGLEAGKKYLERCEQIFAEFLRLYKNNAEPVYISAPGRVEIGGNHTDHQNGCVVAAAINLDAFGVAAKNDINAIRLCSQGYEAAIIGLEDVSAVEADKGTMLALVRGVADGIVKRGYNVGGFDAYLSSDVLNGSGLSSSAAFEVWVGTAMNHLFNDGKIFPVEIAQIGQYAENQHFGKPCGLEDQMASAVGGIVFIDFEDLEKPIVEKMNPNIEGYTLCVIDSGADHADMTEEYAAIRNEMNAVAEYFGKKVLREVGHELFYEKFADVRKKLGDRAVLRAVHFFEDNIRAQQERDAIKKGNVAEFLSLVKESGRSSFMYLQNVIAQGYTKNQELAICLAICDRLLKNGGACRVQGGGFAGTIEAFVPNEILHNFIGEIERLFGNNSCHVLSIRQKGATKL